MKELQMSDLKKIEDAISRHLAGGLYEAASANQKIAAAAMAESDVISHTGRNVDPNDPLYIEAVAEQTLFLLLNVDKLHAPLNEVASQSVEGAGSVTYNTRLPARLMSERAKELCALLGKGALTLRRG